jgi:flagellar M-ring protein FliF
VSTDTVSTRSPRRQLLILGGIFAVVVALLAAGYFLFLRTDYSVLVQGLRPADASAVVAELDKRGVPYRLADGGGTVLVPEAQADATRVAIAGSDVAARGQIGFELFNKSDMGLTNFAQKINYQRALQGELVRTITLMDGVESARVHLALPERTLFRGDRAEPRAAVTVAMKPGQVADPARVGGIQRLVAAAVPDLPEGRVVVLDSGGRVISPAVTTAAEEERSADVEERSAVANYYKARARGAVEARLPGIKFLLRALVLPAGGEGEIAAEGWAPSGEGDQRNFRLRLMLVTEAPLAPADQDMAREAMAQAIGAVAGDSVGFETGPIELPAPVAAPVTAPQSAAQALPEPVRLADPVQWPGLWFWIIAGLVVAALIAWRVLATKRPVLGDTEHEAFAARLRRQLNLEEGPDAAA